MVRDRQESARQGGAGPDGARYAEGMLPASVLRERRARLRAHVEGPILLLGNDERPRNLPLDPFPFRQDSTFLYFVGATEPGAVALLDDDGCTLFLPSRPPDDALWHGPSPSWEAERDRLGVDRIRPRSALESTLGDRRPKTLAVADPRMSALGARLSGQTLAFGSDPGTEELVDAVIRLRRPKAPLELEELRRAAAATDTAFRAVMAATRPGTTERALAALFQGVLAARGLVPGYPPILTVHGEILHNREHVHPCREGQLLLLDGGGEVDTGYTVDVTRTWPVSGAFTGRQRAVYDAVLEAQRQAITACRAGVRYRAVHDTASRVLATFLRDEGLLRCPVEEALETGAHGVFFPHGTGHLLGLDVHDLEAFGDRPSYPPGQARPPQFGTRNLRLDLPLEASWVVTVEPGIYLVPGILADQELRETLGGRVDWERAEDWLGFGGIRLEDDVVVTDDSPEVLTSAIPKDPAAVEALVGSGPTAEERLC